MAMNWKQIETSREARLWIGQVIAPVVTLVVLSSPETREKIGQAILTGASKVKNGVTKTYHKIKSKFNKNEGGVMDDCEFCPFFGHCPTTCKYFLTDTWKQRAAQEGRY